MNNLNDFLQKAAVGDAVAFEEIYKQTYKQVFFTCKALLNGNEDDAADVSQEIYITVLNSINMLNDKSKFESWLGKITVNKCKDYIKKVKPVPIEDEDLFEIVDEKAGENSELLLPEEYVTNQAKRKIIMDIIRNNLSSTLYQTVLLFYFQNMSVNEIAEIMECTVSTVTARLCKARAKIKVGVEKYEKDNNDRLHTVVFVPILFTLFGQEAQACTAPYMYADIMASNAIAVGQATSTAIQVPSSVTQAETVVNVVTTGGKTVFGTLKAKIIPGLLGVAIIGGGITGAFLISRNNEDRNETVNMSNGNKDVSEATEANGERKDDTESTLSDAEKAALEIIANAEAYNTTDNVFDAEDYYANPEEYFLPEEYSSAYGLILDDLEDKSGSAQEDLVSWYGIVDEFFPEGADIYEMGYEMSMLFNYYRYLTYDYIWAYSDILSSVIIDVRKATEEEPHYDEDESGLLVGGFTAGGDFIMTADAIVYMPYYLMNCLRNDEIPDYDAMIDEIYEIVYVTGRKGTCLEGLEPDKDVQTYSYSNVCDRIPFLECLTWMGYAYESFDGLSSHELKFSSPIVVTKDYMQYSWYNGTVTAAYVIPFYDKTAGIYGEVCFDVENTLIGISFNQEEEECEHEWETTTDKPADAEQNEYAKFYEYKVCSLCGEIRYRTYYYEIYYEFDV